MMPWLHAIGLAAIVVGGIALVATLVGIGGAWLVDVAFRHPRRFTVATVAIMVAALAAAFHWLGP